SEAASAGGGRPGTTPAFIRSGARRPALSPCPGLDPRDPTGAAPCIRTSGGGDQLVVGRQLPGHDAPLYHPGTMLMLAFLAGGMFVPGGQGLLPGALREAARRLPRVALALLAVLSLARTMVHSGMIELLAEAAAAAIG